MNAPQQYDGEPIAVLNGRVAPVSQAAISVFDAGFVHAAAVADVVRTFAHRPFRLDDHLARLRRGIESLGIDDAPDDRGLRDAVHQVVEHNAGLIPHHHDLGIVLFATAGWNPAYFTETADLPTCTWGVHTFPLPFERQIDAMQRGLQLVVPESRHIPPACLDVSVKWRSRVHWFLADRHVRKIDPRASALLLDERGFLAETAAANVFVVKDGRLRTPEPRNTLDGVSRRVVFELAEQLQIPCDFADIPPGDAFEADEVFTSSTTTCLTPVATIDGRDVGREIPGPIYLRLMEAWNELSGIDIVEQIRRVARERAAADDRP